MLAAAGAPAAGAIVEIGSFKGRSTVGLAYVARRYGLGNVVAIDPHTSPSTTDPDLGTERSSYDEFQENVRRAGVADAVDCRRALSHEVAQAGWVTSGLSRWRHKFWWCLLPHGPVDPARWAAQVAIK